MQMGCLRVVLGFFAIVFFVLSVYIASALVIGCFQEAAFHREAYALQDHIPAREIFDQSKEYLNLLLSSEELGQRRTHINTDLCIRLNLNEPPWMTRIAYEDWDSIEWLTEEEKEAIRFLVTSEALARNFTSLDIWGRWDGRTELVARLYSLCHDSALGLRLLEIAYNNTTLQERTLYTEYLGDGYYLRIWIDLRGVRLDGFFAWISAILLVTSILLGLVYRRVKSKCNTA